MLIGTHNSTAYTLNFSVGFWPFFNKWNILRLAAKYNLFIRNIIKNTTLCQSMNIVEQLANKVDVLDLRVSWYGKFWCSHTFCTIPLEQVLNDIKMYLLNNPDAHINILIKPDFNNRETMVGREEELAKLLHNFTIYNANIIWYNVDSVDAFKTRFLESKFLSNDGLSCALTPSDASSLTELSKVSLKNYADSLNPIAIQLLKNCKEPPSIAFFDYVDKELIDSIHQ